MKKILLLVVVITVITITMNPITKKRKYGYVSNITIKLKDNEEVLNIPLEEYIIGVVAGEVPATFNIETLKVQAIIARTYALKRYNKKNNYDLENGVSNQVYLSKEKMQERWKEKFDIYYKKIQLATNDTRGLVILYDNKLIDALYFSISTGKTENSEEVFKNKIPYLRSVDSSWDKNITKIKDKKIISSDNIKKIFNIKDKTLNIQVNKKTSIGNCKTIILNDEEHSCMDFRLKLGLKSTNFNIIQTEDSFIFETIGYGHGVGLSQYGANELSKKGYTYKEIINHYYTDVQIKKIN